MRLSVVVTALSFTPKLWPPFIAGILLVGLIYGILGAVVGQLGATYLTAPQKMTIPSIITIQPPVPRLW